MHSNAFLFTEGRWHSFNSACAFNRSIVYSILRILNNEKYIFLKPQGEALSLKEIAKGDFLARFEPVGLHLRSVETHYISQFCSQEIETDFHTLGTECKIYFFARLDRNYWCMLLTVRTRSSSTRKL